jgi:hypothetical protein
MEGKGGEVFFFFVIASCGYIVNESAMRTQNEHGGERGGGFLFFASRGPRSEKHWTNKKKWREFEMEYCMKGGLLLLLFC